MCRLITPSYGEFVRHFWQRCAGWLARGGCQQFWGISSYSMTLDTVVLMGLVRHPMYVVVLSSPIKLLDFIHMHSHVCYAVRTYACVHTHIYLFISYCAQSFWP